VIRRDLETRLPDLTDGEWAWLEQKGYVADVEIADVDPEDLVREVKLIRQAVRRPPKQETVGELADAQDLGRRAKSRAEALSFLLALDASRDPAVVGFRRAELRGRLIRLERVGNWVARRSEPPTELITVTVERPDEPLKQFKEVLEYAAPPASAVQTCPVALGSALDRLRSLSESLANRYGWRPAEAATFVLTGWVPVLQPIRARTQVRLPISAATRITLDIDPTVTPAEVAERYATERGRHVWARTRRMSQKHLQLAMYAEAHQEGTWAERMRGWNEAHPDAAYRQASNFQRDVTRAIDRVLNPLFSSPRGGSKL
jgi:hypothetical protein